MGNNNHAPAHGQMIDGTTIDTPKRRKYNTKTYKLFSDASKEVDDIAT